MKSTVTDMATTFRGKIIDSVSNAPVRTRVLLMEEWTKRFPERRFPDEQSNLNIYLALQYKAEKKRLVERGGEITDRFAANYNKAMYFKGLVDVSLYGCLQIKFNEKKGATIMASKKVKATAKGTKKTSTKNINDAAKNAKAKKERSEGPRTNTVRYTVCSALKAGYDTARVIAEVKKHHDKVVPASRVSMMRSKYNRGGFEHLGFAAPKVPLAGERTPSSGKGKAKATKAKVTKAKATKKNLKVKGKAKKKGVLKIKGIK